MRFVIALIIIALMFVASWATDLPNGSAYLFQVISIILLVITLLYIFMCLITGYFDRK